MRYMVVVGETEFWFTFRKDAVWAADLARRATVEVKVGEEWADVPARGFKPTVWDTWAGRMV